MSEKESRLDKAEKPVLLYFFPKESSFINQDAALFKQHFSLKVYSFLPRHKSGLPFSFLKQKLFLLRNISSASVLVCQFAGYHSLLPVLFARLFHKPCLVIVGGTDCVSFPAINYGNLRKPLLAWFTLKSLKYATHISAPSNSLVEYDYTYTDSAFPKQGYKYFDKSIQTSCTIIVNGVDTTLFAPQPGIDRKKGTFLTLCNYIDQRNFLLKGLDLFIEMASRFPDAQFEIIGRIAPDFQMELPKNVSHTDFIPNALLPSRMSQFQFYCQFSISEGFGVALTEAMSCGCVPLVSKVGIMDFIVGDTGFILRKRDADLLEALIGVALKIDTKLLSDKARQRVNHNFNKEIRESALIALIGNLIHK